MPRFRLDPLSPSGLSAAPEPSKAERRGNGGAVQAGVTDIIAGSNITIDKSNPQKPIVSASSGGGGGSGDVVGPASSTDNAIARFDATTGKVIQNSTIVVKDDGTITTANTELTIEQMGDSFGATRLILRNRSGANGAIFQNETIDLVDFGFLTSSAAQQNIRFEHRSGQVLTGNTAGQFEIGPADTGSTNLIIGNALSALRQGSFGVGIVSPSARLHVYGATGAIIDGAVGGDTAPALQVRRGDVASRFVKFYPSFNGGSDQKIEFGGATNIRFEGGSYYRFDNKVQIKTSGGYIGSFITEAGGEIADFGVNYNQAGDANAAHPGGFFRIDTRSSNTGELFSITYQAVPGSGETQIFRVSTTGNLELNGTVDGRDVSADGTTLDALGTQILLKANDTAVVHKTGAESIAGDKTFTDGVIVQRSYALYRAINTLATQYAGAGMKMYSTAATLAGAAGVEFYAGITDVGATETYLNVQTVDRTGAYLSDVYSINLATKAVLYQGDVTVPDEAYGVGWNGSLEVPTKNAVYDKIETISGGGATVKQTTIDFGSTEKSDEVFNIVDAGISATSKIIAFVTWLSTLGRDADEVMADPISVSVEPLAGSMNIYAMALEGTVSGKYAINYQIG